VQGAELLPGKNLMAAGLAVLAGLLLPLSLAPFDFWWSGLVSVFLLLALLQGANLRQALLRWYLFGIGQFLLGASWVYVSINTHGGASVLLAAGLTGAFIAAISLVTLAQGYIYQRFFSHLQWFWVPAFAALWFFKEWSTTWLLWAGFPWALLGYGHIHSPFAGYAPVLGVLGVGFVVSLCAALLFAATTNLGDRRPVWLVGALGLPGLGLLLGLLNFTQPISEPLKVSLVQGNVAQQTKWRRDMVEPIIRQYAGLTETEWGRDLVVWPEAALTLFVDSAGPVLDSLDARGDEHETALLLGIPRRQEGSYYNSALVTGAGEGSYIKRHLVPFGEYVPLENWLRGAIEFFDLPMSHNRPGPDDQPLLEVKNLKLALSICYEIAFPALVRQDAREAAVLATISNDTWFGRSLGPHQHMQMAQMRALENQRYLVRGTNNGITAVVNASGEITGQLPQFEAGVLRGMVVPLQGLTPYTRLGDWPLLVGLALLLTVLSLRRSG
jgi:apolipoprotein N-acyltransferase